MLFYKVHQCIVQYEMQNILNNSETNFQKITITEKEYSKSQINEHEILINGKMYDIKSKTFAGDRIQLVIIHDSKEENIINEIKRFLTESKQSNKDLPIQLQKLITLNYLSPVKIEILSSKEFITSMYFYFNTSKSNGNFNSIFQPPKFS